MTKTELKPCPFCGSEVSISDVNPIGWPEKSYGVYCSTCGTHWETDEGKSRARAVAAWNRRSDEKKGGAE